MMRRCDLKAVPVRAILTMRLGTGQSGGDDGDDCGDVYEHDGKNNADIDDDCDVDLAAP